MEALLFYALAVAALGAAVVVIGQRNPLYSAFALVVVMGCLAGIYALLRSPFIAVLQMIVYAGAIMVLFLFVLMLLNVQRERDAVGGKTLHGAAFGLVVLLALIVGRVLIGVYAGPGPEGYDASTRTMALQLFSPYFLYTFEATGVLIAGALVGAVVLAKKDL